jgi:hypothetical protein
MSHRLMVILQRYCSEPPNAFKLIQASLHTKIISTSFNPFFITIDEKNIKVAKFRLFYI